MNVVCCEVETFSSGWSFVQRRPTKRGVPECDREATIMRRPWPTGDVASYENSWPENDLTVGRNTLPLYLKVYG